MKKFSHKGVIVAIACRAVALYVGGSIFGLIAPEPHSYARPALPHGTQQDRVLTFADRVAYQYAIEEVYWRHRIWPKENPSPKPSLDDMMSRAQIEQKVRTYLRDSQLLADEWHSPITPEQLQAEMNRMASQSKQPEVLEEIFNALANDPALIAECLARPVLSDRLVHELYAHDESLHSALKQRAENDLRTHPSARDMNRTSGTYGEIELVRSDNPQDEENRDARPSFKLDSHQWDENVQKLAAMFDSAKDSNARSHLARRDEDAAITQIKIGVLSSLQEDDTRYYATTVLKKGKDRLKVATVSWQKQPFESWAEKSELESAETNDEAIFAYQLPEIAAPSTKNPAIVCADNTWIETNTSAPDGREYHTAVWTGSEMIIWGGYNAYYLNSGGRYNPSTDSWVATSTINAPDGREYHKAVWTGNEMIIWGGYNSTYLNSGGRYNPSTDSWVATSTTTAPGGRWRHTAVWTGSEMIVWGGYNGNSDVNSGGRYDPSTDSWIATSTTNAPFARADHTAVWTGSEMIIWGGTAGFPYYQNSGGRYNPTTDSWIVSSTTNAPVARANQTAVWTGSEMIVWGGYYYDGNQHYVNRGGRYNPGTDSWVAISTTNAPDGRLWHTAVWAGSEMIVWGGYNGSSDVNTGGRYNPGTDSWVATSMTNAPDGREHHTAVWTGSEMIIWGGAFSSSYLNIGGRYNPSTNSWVATNPNAPNGRSFHTALWTGSEMIVWGGFNNGITLNSGDGYSPSTDSWVATTATNAPVARANHTAVWTGSEMIVWGGYNNISGYLNSGGRYNPSTDSWAATSTTSAPTVRSYHTAVWTGSEMIVWGGGGYLNSGSRYNPGTDSWVATSTTNAPAARGDHTAVWAGSEMIIWGGYNGSYLNSGGRYNPATDTWIATTTTSAPTAREYHTAVWAGSEMIIWGGASAPFGFENTGGRYNPSTDSWVATSTSSAPDGRQLHTAVWTGSEMIVWGGFAFGELNSGGRYNPSTDSWIATSTTNAPDWRSRHTAVWTGSEMIVWGGGGYLNTGGRYCAQTVPSPVSAASRKTHGSAGDFDVDLPLTGTPGIECRAGGATSDYTMIVTFTANITVTGNPQAEVTLGTGCVGTGATCTGNISVSGSVVTISLTNIANVQTINVRINGVNSAGKYAPTTDFTIPMSILIGDTNANGTVNAADVAQTKGRLGQSIDATNFRSDVNANGTLNAADVAIVKQNSGTSFP